MLQVLKNPNPVCVLFQGCLSLSTVKTAFQETGHKLSSRECNAMAVSALTGFVLYDRLNHVC